MKQNTKQNNVTESGYSLNQPEFRRTNTSRAMSEYERCKCQISVYLTMNGEWYLSKDSTNLSHNGHRYVPPTSKKIKFTQVEDKTNELILKLSSLGITPMQITKLLDEMEQTDQMYDPKTISNIIQQQDELKLKKLGISSKMTSAEKCIALLKKYVPFLLF